MFNVAQVVLSLLSFPFFRQHPVHVSEHADQQIHHHQLSSSKSIAIVGAGSSGLAALKVLLDFPDDVRRNWEIVLYEQRRDVGGIWLADHNPPHPPDLPETPLYPLLRTNTPHPTMTYPGFPFPPMTPLWPSWEYVQRYHADYANHFDLSRHMRLNHTVLASSWVGNSTSGRWNTTISDHDDKITLKSFDHLIVASGHNHYPHIPTWPGQDEWLQSSPDSGPQREILHSIFYRSPDRYTDRSVLVVGGGASGRDALLQITPLARKIYHSVKVEENFQLTSINTTTKPEISHFTLDAVVFVDGTEARDVDALILGTGYDLRIPFLDRGNALYTDPSVHTNDTYTLGLTTNLRYLFPLHQHIFSLCPSHPPTALTFVGLPLLVANCPSDIAQSLIVAHAIANSSLLPSREEMLAQLATHEDALRAQGYDPFVVGHRLVGGVSQDYQDELVQYLKDRGAIPNDGKKYVEEWRRSVSRSSSLLRNGWDRLTEAGLENEWLEGVRTEGEWADFMERVILWERDWEEREGKVPLYNDDTLEFVARVGY